MTHCYGTTIDVDLRLIQAEKLQVGKRNNAECLIELIKVDLVGRDPGVGERLGDGKRRCSGEVNWRMSGVSETENLCKGLNGWVGLQESSGAEKNGRGPVRDGGCIGRSDCSGSGDEDGTDGFEFLNVKLWLC